MTYADKFFDLIGVRNTQFERVRVGSNNDGGYVVPVELCKNISHLFSIGIGDDALFELDFRNRFGAEVTCFDPYINELPVASDFLGDLRHIKTGIGIGESLVPMRVLQREYMNVDGNKAIKIDIEYSEWDHVNYSKDFDMMIIELHILTVEDKTERSSYFHSFYERFYNEVNESLFKKYFFFLDAILNNYFIFHLHANNSIPFSIVGKHTFPPLMELTLINRKFFIEDFGDVKSFPLLIDKPNKTDRPDVEFTLPL